jgi:hypothetical protein
VESVEQRKELAANWAEERPANRLLAGFGLGVLSIGAAATAYFDPTKTHFFPVCPLFALTGFACPGCGLTRGFHALFQGDIATSLGYNALIPVWVVIFAYVWTSLMLSLIRGRGLEMWPTSPTFLWGFLIVLCVFGVLRNVPVYPLTLLFP